MRVIRVCSRWALARKASRRRAPLQSNPLILRGDLKECQTGKAFTLCNLWYSVLWLVFKPLTTENTETTQRCTDKHCSCLSNKSFSQPCRRTLHPTCKIGSQKAHCELPWSGTMKAIAVIPARLASTRLPRKMLRDIAGQPLVGRVYDAVCACASLADVIIATDSDEIMEVCRRNSWKAQMTSASHRSG